ASVARRGRASCVMTPRPRSSTLRPRTHRAVSGASACRRTAAEARTCPCSDLASVVSRAASLTGSPITVYSKRLAWPMWPAMTVPRLGLAERGAPSGPVCRVAARRVLDARGVADVAGDDRAEGAADPRRQRGAAGEPALEGAGRAQRPTGLVVPVDRRTEHRKQ